MAGVPPVLATLSRIANPRTKSVAGERKRTRSEAQRKRATETIRLNHLGGARNRKRVAPRGGQTLDRGVRILKTLAESNRSMSLREIAATVGIHRSAAYRLLRVLLDHELVAREANHAHRLGPGIITLTKHLSFGDPSVVRPILIRLAETVGATSFLTVADQGEAVALIVVEPSHTAMHVAYRTGFRHPLTQSAAGIAILAGRSAVPGEAPMIALARRRGHALSRGELQSGAVGLAVPIRRTAEICRASVGVVTLGDLDERKVARRVVSAARAIAPILDRACGLTVA
jgi:DNA-binding IclR family transcriptional regulator